MLPHMNCLCVKLMKVATSNRSWAQYTKWCDLNWRIYASFNSWSGVLMWAVETGPINIWIQILEMFNIGHFTYLTREKKTRISQWRAWKQHTYLVPNGPECMQQECVYFTSESSLTLWLMLFLYVWIMLERSTCLSTVYHKIYEIQTTKFIVNILICNAKWNHLNKNNYIISFKTHIENQEEKYKFKD